MTKLGKISHGPSRLSRPLRSRVRTRRKIYISSINVIWYTRFKYFISLYRKSEIVNLLYAKKLFKIHSEFSARFNREYQITTKIQFAYYIESIQLFLWHRILWYSLSLSRCKGGKILLHDNDEKSRSIFEDYYEGKREDYYSKEEN